jgi:hypothetical protein
MSTMPPENRFAEVTRKSREARARLIENQRLREAAERRVPRDRDYVTAEPQESAGTPATSAVDRASAALDGEDDKAKP